jgi:large subunit ribosomal protein L25
VDVSNLNFGVVLRVSDLPHSDKLRFLTAEDKPVAHVVSIKEEVVAPTPEAEAAAAAAVPAEPEVLKKGKQETAEGAAAAAAPAAEKSDKGGKK